MRITHGTTELLSGIPNPAVTIGVFDGVHRGHQALINRALQQAAAIKGVAMALTFAPHPQTLIRPQTLLPLITTQEQKMDLLSLYGLEQVAVLEFDEVFLKIGAEDFIRGFLVEMLKAKEVIVGYNFTFGNGGRGKKELLQEMADQYGFNLSVVPPVMFQGSPISSSRIRRIIEQGDMHLSYQLLGRYFALTGKVEPGHQRGAKLGFPTANLTPEQTLLPPQGVYAAEVYLPDYGTLNAVANLGHNPTFGQDPLSLEVHILDFDEDLYGQYIEVGLKQRLRDEIRFNSAEELVRQMRQDVKEAAQVKIEPLADTE